MESSNISNANSQSRKQHPENFALIIGAMKSGTTSLFDILSQHPQICPAKIKEPDYFIKDRDTKAREDYLSLWDWKDGSHVVALESSVAYTKAPYIPDVPERINKSGLGKFRFIYMLRDPLSRIESQARHAIFAGWGKSLDVEISEDLINFSCYVMQLDNYLKYYSTDDIMLITLEEFNLTPHSTLTKICNFLEIDSKFQFTNVAEPRNSGDFFNAPPVVAHLTQGGFGQFISQKILPVKFKKGLRNIISKLNKPKKKDSNLVRWQLNTKERELILRKLEAELKRLESEFGVDVKAFWDIPSKYIDRG